MSNMFGNISAGTPGIHVELDERLLRQQAKAFAKLMVNEPDARKRIRKIVSEELKDAAKRLREDAKYEMKEDPRKAYQAVKTMLYKRILGGNVSILARKKAGTLHPFHKERKIDSNPYQRGGNRRRRSADTERMDSYYGRDRAFILQMLNAGAKAGGGERTTRYGKRGAIAPRNWFVNMAPHEIQLAAENLAEVIDDELAEAYAKEIKQ